MARSIHISRFLSTLIRKFDQFNLLDNWKTMVIKSSHNVGIKRFLPWTFCFPILVPWLTLIHYTSRIRFQILLPLGYIKFHAQRPIRMPTIWNPRGLPVSFLIFEANDWFFVLKSIHPSIMPFLAQADHAAYLLLDSSEWLPLQVGNIDAWLARIAEYRTADIAQLYGQLTQQKLFKLWISLTG